MTNDTDTWFHPLTAKAVNPVNRRRFLTLVGAGAAAAAARPQLSLVAQTPAASPEAAIQGDPEAVALLDAAAAAMADLDSFAFEIETVQGESTILEGLTLGLIEGNVRRPIDFTATVTVSLPFGGLTVTAVGIDGQAWIQNPLDDGAWISLADAAEVIALVNPDTLILAALRFITDLEIDGTEQVDGVDTTRLTGVIDLSDLAQGMDDDAAVALAGEPLDVTLWIDDESMIREIELVGPLLTSESDDVVRVVRFFDFNEPVEIEAPPA
jgi:lipoprotein LprA